MHSFHLDTYLINYLGITSLTTLATAKAQVLGAGFFAALLYYMY